MGIISKRTLSIIAYGTGACGRYYGIYRSGVSAACLAGHTAENGQITKRTHFRFEQAAVILPRLRHQHLATANSTLKGLERRLDGLFEPDGHPGPVYVVEFQGQRADKAWYNLLTKIGCQDP